MRQIELAAKRFIDIFSSILIFSFGFPFFLLIGLLVKSTSPGPVLFVQPRVGKDEKIFHLVKFRSMIGSPDPTLTTWSKSEEARITSVGRFLRDYGLDELPQVYNIIKGDMSIVGPRPPLPDKVNSYTLEQRKIFSMRPGVLSLAAIQGRRSIPMNQRIALHMKYVENWSFKLDIHIFCHALLIVVRKKDAVESVVQCEKERA